jgi:hypothetical protein
MSLDIDFNLVFSLVSLSDKHGTMPLFGRRRVDPDRIFGRGRLDLQHLSSIPLRGLALVRGGRAPMLRRVH